MKKFSLRHALWLIFIWTALISGMPYLVFGLYSYLKGDQKSGSHHAITALLLECSSREQLPSNFFAETIDWTANQLHLWQRELEAHPIIDYAKMQRYNQNTLWIEYAVRTPIAFVADLDNVAVDCKGKCFPLHPFVTPKLLPKIFLGLSEEEINRFCQTNELEAIVQKKLHFAIDWLDKGRDLFQRSNYYLGWLDVSLMDETSLGKRKMVLGLSKMPREPLCCFLRIYPEKEVSELESQWRLLAIQNFRHQDKPIDIDMRLPSLAYITYGDTL
jgi:hypothetical protein